MLRYLYCTLYIYLYIYIHTHVYGLSRNYYNKILTSIQIVCNIQISMYLLALRFPHAFLEEKKKKKKGKERKVRFNDRF